MTAALFVNSFKIRMPQEPPLLWELILSSGLQASGFRRQAFCLRIQAFPEA